jgi:drug/metabolite transporter (DMT)-like permease
MSNRISLFIGLLAGFVSALIAASWQTATRYGVTSSLLASDLALLRYGIPALVLAPLLIKQGVLPARVHRGWFFVMASSGGIGYGALAMIGAHYSPVAHMGILLSGTVPLFTALLLYATTRAAVSMQRRIGYALILFGALGFGFASARLSLTDVWYGDLLFIAASISWAIYTLALRKLALSPWYATALVCFWSSLAALGWILMRGQTNLGTAPIVDLGLQIALQGFVAGLLGSTIYVLCIRKLGASNATIFGALVPVLAAICGYLFLGETISVAAAIAISTVVIGIVFARERSAK